MAKLLHIFYHKEGTFSLLCQQVLLFVSHSIEQVKKICNKIVWLDHGKVRMYGNTREVCEEYEKI